jgi:PD-(D/E)XK nuclease superfamily
MKISVRRPLYELPPYSLTADILSFETCPLQYRYERLGNLPSSRPVQLWFGQFIHGVLEESYRRYVATPDSPPPWPTTDVEQIAERISNRLRTQGLLARSRMLERIGFDRAERAINLLGPFLLPLINRVEVRLSGARTIDRGKMPELWAETRNLDRYELVEVVDVVSHVELRRVQAANPIVDVVRRAIPVLPEEFEIIVDYKGMRRPSTTRRQGRLDLAAYEWQLQNYAYLRERQGEGPPVAVGVLLFLNELNPTLDDFATWRRESKAGLTDVPIPPDANWKSPNDIPDPKKFERMIHVTVVTSESRKLALSAFDNVARNIEICRGNEASGMKLFQAWPGNPNDEATCAACDARTFCPALKKKNPKRTQVPLLPVS